jgi:hypothetical protein
MDAANLRIFESVAPNGNKKRQHGTRDFYGAIEGEIRIPRMRSYSPETSVPYR